MFGTLPPMLPRFPAVPAWHTFPPHLCDWGFLWCPLTQIHMKSNGPVSSSLLGGVNGSEWPWFPYRWLWGQSLVTVGAQNIAVWDVSETLFFVFLLDAHPWPEFYICVCNRVFELRADMNVCGLFCICVFVSIKGLTVISEVAKGDLASVIIPFTLIMELNIEEVIAGSRHTTIISTQGDSFSVPPEFQGLQRVTVSREERPWLRNQLRVGGLKNQNEMKFFCSCFCWPYLLMCLFFDFSILAQTLTLVYVISI